MTEENKIYKQFESHIQSEIAKALRSEIMETQKRNTKAIEGIHNLMKEIHKTMKTISEALTSLEKRTSKIEKTINPKQKRRKTKKISTEYIS